jgi:raffinose/stachyose/melibiose transport system substrate-binding protein
MWEGPMFDPLTYSIVRVADFNRDGFVGNDELYVAFKTDRISFHHPAIEARYKMLREVTDHFQTGYTGLTRDEAVFLFAQQRAVFMTTGTWDARSLQAQAQGAFEVGVMDFPLPASDDPYYGDIIEGPCYERLLGGFPFGVTRTSKHPDVARDFLFYLASQPQNERLNQIIGWIPAVRGAQVDPLLKAFEPHLEGVYGNLNLFLGGETWIRWLQLYTKYQVNQLTYEELASQFEPYYEENGLKDLLEQQKDWRRAMQNNEQYLAGVRADALYAPEADADALWIKYRTLTASRQIWPEINHTRQFKMLEEGPNIDAVGPYEYSPAVLDKIRARVRKKMEEKPPEAES